MGGRSEGFGGLRDGHVRSRCGSQQRLQLASCASTALRMRNCWVQGPLFLGRSNHFALEFERVRRSRAF